jgi:hypothetical protein
MALNKMNLLLNKIERRLGTKPLMLPEDISKNTWVDEVIVPDTLLTFSRYFPHMVQIKIDTNDKTKKKDGYFLIDTNLLGGQEILGVKDIDWRVYGREDGGLAQQSGLGYFDYMSAYNNYSMDDVMLLQARADMTSIFNNTIFVDFKEPNRIRLQSVTYGDITGGLGTIPLDVFVCHPPNLMTISPTKMGVFENLATADVASFLVAYLQHYDGLETVFAGVDLKLNSLENWAGRREDYINELKEAYVSPSNDNQPIMYCV